MTALFPQQDYGDCRLICGDALAVLPTLPDASVHLILTDPPYFRTKMDYLGETVTWDRQWKTQDAYLRWLAQLAKEWQRVLTPNGSLYCFASPAMAWHVEGVLREVFHVLQRITWRKPAFSTKAEMFDKESCRQYFPVSETILFAEQRTSEDYAQGESGYQRAELQLKTSLFSQPIAEAMAGTGKNARELTEAIGAYGKVNHGGAVSNWLKGYNIPTKAQYEAMRAFFNMHTGPPEYLRVDYEYLRVDYEKLRQNYEELRQNYEELRRPFTVTAAGPYTDVWDFATVPYQPGKHPCEKPLPLLRHIITTSSRPGDVVLDCCMGRGSTLVAARQCGRQSLGIDQDPQWWRAACQRLSQGELFTEDGA